MPRKKSQRKKRKASKRQIPLSYFLVAGIVCTALIWLITSRSELKPGADLPQPKKLEVTRSQPPERAETAVSKEQPPIPKPETLVKQALQKLGVPESSVNTRKSGDTISIKVPIDRSRMDLTFANMIIKSELERSGASFVLGEEKGGHQILEFAKNNLKYKVNLFYDSAPYIAPTGKKYIAIVVDDFGSTSGDLLDGFFALPTEVTFAIFPDMAKSIETMNRAYKQGRETLIHIPMEPIDYPRVNPGQDPILVQMGEASIDRLLRSYLNKMPHCLGINNHMGSLATTDPEVMGYVMKPLKEKGKVFLDSRTSNVSVAYQVAQKALVKAYRNDVFLDSPDISAANLDKKLKQIVALGTVKQNVIAITHCHNNDKLEYLKKFISRLQAEGFTLVPLSRLSKYDVPAII